MINNQHETHSRQALDHRTLQPHNIIKHFGICNRYEYNVLIPTHKCRRNIISEIKLMKTFEIVISIEIMNLHQNNHQSRPKPNSLKVGKEIELGSSSRGLNNRIENLAGGPFPFSCKSKIKGSCCGHNKW
jgi:hypothetical protein